MKCAELAKPQPLITHKNKDSLMLSNYKRLPGEVVYISCLNPLTHRLRGNPILTCKNTGEWDHPIPVCVDKKTIKTEITTKNSTYEKSKMESAKGGIAVSDALPYIITVSVLVFLFLCLIIVLIYLSHLRRKLEGSIREVKCATAEIQHSSSGRSPPTLCSTAYDFYTHSEYAAPETLNDSIGSLAERGSGSVPPKYQDTVYEAGSSNPSSLRYTTIGDYLVYRVYKAGQKHHTQHV